MANSTLNDRYGIPYGSEWVHEDGSEYLALAIEHSFKTSKIPIICYIKILTDEGKQDFRNKGIMNQFVKTVDHFKRSFKAKDA